MSSNKSRQIVDWLDTTMVILVVYEEKIEESKSFVSLGNALKKISGEASMFVYDNSTTPQELPDNSVWGIVYVHNSLNPGVSKAYNEGFQKAKALNKKWLLLADQDTHFPFDYFEKIYEAFEREPLRKLYAPIVKNEANIISPFQFSFGKGRVIANVQPGTYSLDKVKVINSGLVVSIDLFEGCGGFDERFPLDFSDLTFNNRASRVLKEVEVFNSICMHGLSSEDNSYAKMSSRFLYYLRGSKLFGKLYGGSFFLLVIRFFRSIKLSFKFRSWSFVRLFFRIEGEQIF